MTDNFLTSTVLNSHAVILQIPRGYGFKYSTSKINFPDDADVIFMFPRIHDNQKTESINVDDILDLESKARVKASKSCFYVIYDAEKMTKPAQEKFLKLLEEPQKNIHFILVLNSAEKMLITVRSRAQKVILPPVSEFESLKIIKKHKLDEKVAKQIMFLAKGLPEELENLASNKKYLKQRVETMEYAKKWLSGSDFDRVKISAELSKDRNLCLNVLTEIFRILDFTTNEKTAVVNSRQAKKLFEVYRNIEKNHNIKVELLRTILA